MESISRISSLLETARDLTLEAARDAGPRRSTRPLPAQQVRKLLDSRNEREVLDGLRRVVAMQYANPPQPTLTFFPAVLKTLSTPFPSTRPLVYNYLLHHADLDPDTALLSINTIQKSISDSNPRVRAMALKTMSGIRVPVISQIVSLAIKKGVSDLSPLVRKVAALSCVKCVRLDPSTRPQVEDYLTTLLADKQYYVAGAAVQAFMEICPDRLDMIHPVYRRLCRMVVDMDEWGQLALIRLMINYSRQCFPLRTKRVKRAAATREQKNNDFYDDIEPEDESEAQYDDVAVLDPDLDLFLKSIQPLLSSRNSAVIVAVTRAYLYLSPTTHLHLTIDPLLALLRAPSDIEQVALHYIVQVCLVNPALFARHYRHFLVRSTEGPQIWQLKLEVLTLLFPHAAPAVRDLILAELEHFSHSRDATLVRESVRALGRCAASTAQEPATARRCLTLLLKQLHSADENLVGGAMEVVRHLIQRDPAAHRKTVIRLAKNLDSLTSSTARASIIWLVGEYSSSAGAPEEDIAPDVLRILVKRYAEESEAVRAQIVLLAAKVYLNFLNARNEKQKALDVLNGSSTTNVGVDHPAVADKAGGFADEPQGTVELLYHHTMLLARYTPSYDLRDRARLFRALLRNSASTELASLLLLAPKPVPHAPSPSEARRSFALGSASLIVGSEEAGAHGVPGYEAIPEWVEEGEEPDAKLRDDRDLAKSEYVPASSRTISAGQMLDQALEKDPGYSTKNGGKEKKEKTLDAWLDEEESEEEADDDEDEDDDEEDSDDDSSESYDEDDSEEEETESEDEADERVGLVR